MNIQLFPLVHAYQMLESSTSGGILKTIPPENQKSGNVMQQTMHSYVCGINLRSEISLVLSDLHFAYIGVPEFDRNVFIARKVNLI